MAYTKYSLTPANNNATPPDGAPEGMLPSAVNDTMRDMMAQIRDCGDGIRDGTYTMTAPKITGGTITGAAFTGNTFTSPVISGGTINNAVIGGSTPAAGTFTSLSDSGNLTFTGTGNRITGDFSNATVANRVLFQTSTTNGNTIPTAIPNGTSQTSGFSAYNNSDPTNASLGQIRVTASTVDINSTIVGSGTYLPITMLTGGSERLRIDTSGNVGIAVTPSAWASANNGVLQMQRASIAGLSTNDLHASSNAYYDNTNWRYIASSVAVANYYQSAGTHVWRYAAAGTAGNTISWSEAMRISSAGLVSIGMTGGSGVLNINNATVPNCRLHVNGTLTTDFYASGSDTTLNTVTNGYLAFGTNNTERMRIDSSGNVNIATAGVYLRLNSASSTFDLSGQAGATDFLRINANGTQRFQFNTAGQAYNSTGTWGTISDARLKENIADATPKLDSLNQLRVVNFNFKDEPDVKQIGFIAQEVEQIFPGLVSEGADDGEGGYYKAVKTTVLIPMLVKAMQEQQAMIEELKQEVAKLKGV